MWNGYAREFKFQWTYATYVEMEALNEIHRIDGVIDWHAERGRQANLIQEAESQREQAAEQQRVAHMKRVMYGIFDVAHQLQSRIPDFEEDQVHLLAHGYDTKLLLPAAEPKKEDKDDNCSICLNKLYTKNGRQRSLACGHTWHHDCIFEWLKVESSCPMCRKKYNILHMPDLSDDDSMRGFHDSVLEGIGRNVICQCYSCRSGLGHWFVDGESDFDGDSDNEEDPELETQAMQEIEDRSEALDLDGNEETNRAPEPEFPVVRVTAVRRFFGFSFFGNLQ